MIFNWILFIILFIAISLGEAAGYLSSHVFSASAETTSSVGFVTMLLAATVIDITYRRHRGEEEDADAGFGLIHPQRGAQFMFLPLWLLSGAALLGLTIEWLRS